MKIEIIITVLIAGFFIYSITRYAIAIDRANKEYEAETERLFPNKDDEGGGF